MKVCIQCGESKPLDHFYKDARRKDGRGIYCKLCWKIKYQTSDRHRANRSSAVRAYYRKNSGTEEWKEKRKYDQLRYLYGISREQYDELLERQNNACAVCYAKFTEVIPHVDHDHTCCTGNKSCGKCIRGILCPQCNTALGLLKDNTTTLARALDYLKENSYAP